MPPKVPQTYPNSDRIKKFAKLPTRENISSLVRNNALSAIYGVGVGVAVLRNELNLDFKEKPNVNGSSGVLSYNPDALVENGAYQSTDRWDGQMSSALAGMPVMCSLKFESVDYVTLQGDTISLPEVMFENIVISVNVNKNINKTQITGRDTGSVKEFIGLGDFDIELRVLITSDAPVNDSIQRIHKDGVYPRENMDVISDMILAPISIPIECWFLLQFGIEYLVIESARFEQIEGQYETQVGVIQCVSDSPLIIKVIS